METNNKWEVNIYTERSDDDEKSFKLHISAEFFSPQALILLNYIGLRSKEVREISVRMIKRLRKCSAAEANILFFKYSCGAIFLRPGRYSDCYLYVKRTENEIQKIFLDFVKEHHNIPHVTIEKEGELSNLHEELARICIERGMPTAIGSKHCLPNSILRLQIENYFNGGKFAHIVYKWENKGNPCFDPKEIFSGFPVYYSPPVTEYDYYQKHSVLFRRKEGAPIFRVKILIDTPKREVLCQNITFETDIVNEPADLSYSIPFHRCCHISLLYYP